MKVNLSRVLASSCAAAALLLASNPAFAVIECKTSPKNYFVGDGMLYINWNNGGVGIISQEDPDFKPTLALVTVAMTNKTDVVIRYADGANCSSSTSATPIIGLWLTQDPSH